MALSQQMQDYVSKNTAYLATVSADIDDMASKAKALQDKLTAIDNSPAGPWSAEDQQSLTDALDLAKALVAKADTADGKVQPTPPNS